MLIFLIGMMGSGKTIVGKHLSDSLGYKFIDTDDQIELNKGMSITEIIHEFGIEKFREYEIVTLKKTKLPFNTVISTGGGIILNSENRQFMKKNGVVVYLKTSVKVIENRLTKADLLNRPLLKTNKLFDIYQERKTYYEVAANFTILCDDLSVEDICLNIIKKLNLK